MSTSRIMIKFSFLIIVLTIVVVFLYKGFATYHSEDNGIRDFNFAKDHVAVDELFHKEDNWYWLIATANQDTYSVDYMLRYKTSSQYVKKGDLIIKVLEIDNNIAGFCAYYPKSMFVWQLLFLIVDPEYRKKGLSKKILNYAVRDMVNRGAIKVDLYTRLDNIRAHTLYTKFGFKALGVFDEGMDYSWYKNQL